MFIKAFNLVVKYIHYSQSVPLAEYMLCYHTDAPLISEIKYDKNLNWVLYCHCDNVFAVLRKVMSTNTETCITASGDSAS